MAYWGIYRVLLVTGGPTQLGCAVISSWPVPPELVLDKEDIVGSLLSLRPNLPHFLSGDSTIS